LREHDARTFRAEFGWNHAVPMARLPSGDCSVPTALSWAIVALAALTILLIVLLLLGGQLGS